MKKTAAAGRPFFSQLSWNALHASENALEATLAKYERLGGPSDGRRASVAAITADLDTGVGRVLEAIDRLGIAGTIYVVYLSDNGSGGGRRGLRGGKGSVWEGGIRVPLIVRGPGVAPNSWCHVPVVGYDMLSTFCGWAGVPATALPQDIEGGSISPLLARAGVGTVERPRAEPVFHFPHHQSGNTPHSAIRLGNLKLLKFYEDDSVKPFDLETDLGERNDLATQRPADAMRLGGQLETYLADVDAQRLTINPQYDPTRPAAPCRRRGGTAKGVNKKDRP